MVKPNVSGIMKSVKIFASKHAPEILTGIGVSGMIAATGLAITETPKALKLIELRKEEEGVDELSPVEIAKTVWKCYIPAAVTLTVSAACIIGASAVNVRRNAALATAYTLSETALSEYREKVIDTIGPEKEKEVRDKIDRDRVERNPIGNSEVIVTGRDNMLCLDCYAGRYFESSADLIDRAVNELNRQMLINDYVSLNDFYDELGLEHTPLGDQLGWRIDKGYVKISYSSQLTEDRKPCLVLSYELAPEYDYAKFT